MSYYIQYHNVDKEGLPLGESPFSEARLGIHTRLPHVQNASGIVFLIVGMGKPRRYYLWDCFEIDKVEAYSDDDDQVSYQASGAGWQLAPPQLLDGKDFDRFRISCANFVGFRNIDDLPYTKVLRQIADKYRPPGKASRIQQFLETIGRPSATRAAKKSRKTPVRKTVPIATVNPSSASSQDGADRKMRALSIRQPHAEAIMRGIKKIEYRTKATRIRGRIQIYASLGRYSAQDESEMMDEYGIRDVSCDELPRGVLIGTVDLFDCDEGDWSLRKPERATRLLKPRNHPQPVWFNPF